jgi:hypothetical protein
LLLLKVKTILYLGLQFNLNVIAFLDILKQVQLGKFLSKNFEEESMVF